MSVAIVVDDSFRSGNGRSVAYGSSSDHLSPFG